MQLRYFAWVRERIGKASEDYEGDAKSVSALLDELQARGEGYEAALHDREIIRVAIDQEILTGEDAQLIGVKEVAIFPPMTGG